MERACEFRFSLDDPGKERLARPRERQMHARKLEARFWRASLVYRLTTQRQMPPRGNSRRGTRARVSFLVSRHMKEKTSRSISVVLCSLIFSPLPDLKIIENNEYKHNFYQNFNILLQ